MDKTSNFHRVADKSLDLISKISYMSDSIRNLLVNTSEEAVNELVKQSKDLDLCIESYKNCLIVSIEEIVSDKDDEVSIDAIENDNGYKL